jgi:dipeptidyl-peptidase-4
MASAGEAESAMLIPQLRKTVVLSALACLVAAPLCAQRKPLTIERIYSQPSLSGAPTTGLQWRPDGRQLSYFQRSGTGREARTDVWVMDVPSGERRMLLDSTKLAALVPQGEERGTVATGLGRVAPQRAIWSPDGDQMLFVAQGNLYWFDLKTQAGKRLTSSGPKNPIEDPRFSPDGKAVSFVRDYDVWAVTIATARERRVTTGGKEEVMNGKLDWVYPEELGIRTAYWWSPDSRQIAFLQMDQRPVTRYPLVDHLSYTGETNWMRYPKAGDANPIVKVGVVAAAGGPVRWMDIGANTDIYIPRVNWLRDGKRLAIQRLNRAQNKLELLFASAVTGKSTVTLVEEDPQFINVSDELFFLTDGSGFLWSSERGGFRHLYLYDMAGKLVRPITTGNWEVGGVSNVAEKTGQIYFTASEKSALERHLYRVALAGGAPVRITQAAGSHGINMAPDAAHFVDSYSNASAPSRQDLYRSDGTLAFTINENKVAELADFGLVTPEFSTIPDGRGGTLNTMMIKPPDFDPTRKYPVLMYTYGGPSSQVVANSWSGARGLWHQMMAQKGYIIFSADNGGAAGRGHGSETPMHRNLGEVEVAEQVAAANWIKSQPYVDRERVGIHGWSYGGYMACMLMLKTAGTFKAGFAGAPVTDWRQYDTIYTERYMGLPKDNAEAYARSAPTAHAANLKGKLLIAHGTGDDNVHFTNTIKLQEELVRANRYAEIVLYPGRGHGVGDPPAQRHLWARITQFFLDNL